MPITTKPDPKLVVSAQTTDAKRNQSHCRFSEILIQLPKHDTDIHLRLPSGRVIAVQFRVEQPSIDLILLEDCAVTCWEGDDMEPAKAMRAKPGVHWQSHIRFAKQLAIPLPESVLDEEGARGWVFVDDECGNDVGFAEPGDYVDADSAVHSFGKQYGNDFSVYFRDTKGEMNACDADSRPEHFE